MNTKDCHIGLQARHSGWHGLRCAKPAPSGDFEFTANGFQQTDCSDEVTQGFIMKFLLNGETVTRQYATLIGKADEGCQIEAINMDSQRNIFFAGFGSQISTLQDDTDYCLDPDPGIMPICNSTDEAYMETDWLDLEGNHTYMGVINSAFEMKWCTQYGDGTHNRPTALTTNEEKLFMVGVSDYDWTLVEFDDSDFSLDYYKTDLSVELKPTQDGTIARFNIAEIFDEIVSVSDNDTEETFHIIPNPANQIITLSGPNLGNSSIKIFDLIGRQVLTLDKVNLPNTLSIENLASGLYTLQLFENGKYHNIKFIKQ